MALMVIAVRAEALDIVSITLGHPLGLALPAFAPGDHLEIALPQRSAGDTALVRHYSLCNSPAETDRYVVAVARAADGRGGSQAMHEVVRVGTRLTVRPPRSNFPLAEDAGHYRFIAGGIGITPILSMIRWCEVHRKSWSLIYCTRSRVRTAFYEELRKMGAHVRFHFDDESEGRHVDFVQELAHPESGEHIYCCGPNSMMRAVEIAAAGRSRDAIHFEWFSVEKVECANSMTSHAFDILIHSTGARFRVPPERSILETLEDNGVSVPFSCREGLCRTCETAILSGEADHRDCVLSKDEQSSHRSLMICVSRAKTAVLELDL